MSSYYERNREFILEKCKEKNRNKNKAEAEAEYQKEFLKNHYRETILQNEGRVVVPTARRCDANGNLKFSKNRLHTMGDVMHKRHLIARRLLLNDLKAEQFKKMLSAENI